MSSNSSASQMAAFQELSGGDADFFEQMLSALPSSWPDLDSSSSSAHHHFSSSAAAAFDDSAMLASRLRHHQIGDNGGGGGGGGGLQLSAQQQQLLLSSLARSPAAADFDSPFKSPNSSSNGGGDQGMFNGFGNGALQQHFHQSQVGSAGLAQSLGGGGGAAAGAAASEGGGGGAVAAAAAPRQRVRARRGQATDPHSIAERLRRERIAERMKALQELVPNANKTDKASMLDEIIDYVKFLQLQVKVLSMSRLGGAAAVAPLVADVSSETGGRTGSNTCGGTPSTNDSLTVTEQQVAKLMEEDMGSAMQYLQGKGLCLMPISLASAISTATCRTASAPIAGFLANVNGVDGPSSPSPSVLTVQSAVASSAKEARSVTKP